MGSSPEQGETSKHNDSSISCCPYFWKSETFEAPPSTSSQNKRSSPVVSLSLRRDAICQNKSWFNQPEKFTLCGSVHKLSEN